MLYSAAISAAICGWGVKLLIGVIGPVHPAIAGVAILGVYGVVYFLAGSVIGIKESQQMVKRVFSMVGISRRGA